MNMPALFDDPSGFPKNENLNILQRDGEAILISNFFNKIESDKFFEILKNNISWKQEQINIYGNDIDIPRLTAWYGDEERAYTYSGIKMHPNPWTNELLEIKNKIEKHTGIGFSSVLLNMYRSGRDSVSWHCDDEKELGKNPTIASVSFGATRDFHFRHLKTRETKKIKLNHGSLLLMKGETQHYWEHQIPKTKRKVSSRINLTFRNIT